MPRESILRIYAVIFEHQPVARDLCHDGGGGYREAGGIAADDAFYGAPRDKLDASVDYYVIGWNFKVGYGDLHRFYRGAIYIYIVDGLLVDYTYADETSLEDLAVRLVPELGGKFLRVVDALAEICVFQDNGARDDRSGQRTAACFIDARYCLIAETT